MAKSKDEQDKQVPANEPPESRQVPATLPKGGAVTNGKTMADMPEIQPIEEGDNIKLPRLNLIQEKRKEIKEGLAAAGDLFNSLTKESYGREVKIVPLIQRPLTRIRWKDRDEGGGMLCISRNKAKPFGEPGDQYNSCEPCPFFRNYDPKIGCTMNYEIVGLVVNGEDPKFWEPILVTAESTRPSDAGFRDILANVRYNAQRGIRMFHKAYILKSIDARNKFGEFYKVSCIPADKNGLLPLDVIDFLEAQVKFFLGARIDTAGAHGEGGAEETPVASAEDADPNW